MRKRTAWLVVLAVVVALCVGGVLIGAASLFRPNNAHALDYGYQIKVRGGYQRIDSCDGGEGSCGCDLGRVSWIFGQDSAIHVCREWAV